MFEKEAEEYARQNNPAKYGVRATHFTVLHSFKDGAEYGYNKAKKEISENTSCEEEMAEEWVKNNLHSTEEDYIKAFKDGAEFGFQKGIKAKLNFTTISDCPIKDEWHYVKDEGTPEVEGHYLVCMCYKDSHRRNREILDCWIYYDKGIGWYSMSVHMNEIYAWKEIVLPKEE